MMESGRSRPEYLMGPLEFDTEFYSSSGDSKWTADARPVLGNSTDIYEYVALVALQSKMVIASAYRTEDPWFKSH
jgi:hypothetical protein